MYNFSKKYILLKYRKGWNPFEFIPETFYLDRTDGPEVKNFLDTYDRIS